ncbi:hypothetical protein Q7P37_011402 [Cladosporium fusiforme]
MPRPEINATFRICHRDLEHELSPAVQAANLGPINIKRPKSRERVQDWADEIELDILIAFNVDPSRYVINLHEEVPERRRCPMGDDARELAYIDIDEDEEQIVTGTFDVHFVLRDDVEEPTVEELRKWQKRWLVISADPPLPTFDTVFSICGVDNTTKKLDVSLLPKPRVGDVAATIRQDLGLQSTADLMNANVAHAMGIDLERDEITYHLASGDCDDCREIEELDASELEPSDAIKLHVERLR